MLLCYGVMYYYASELLCYYATMLLYYFAAIPLYYHTTVLLYDYTTILFSCHTTVLLYCYATILLCGDSGTHVWVGRGSHYSCFTQHQPLWPSLGKQSLRRQRDTPRCTCYKSFPSRHCLIAALRLVAEAESSGAVVVTAVESRAAVELRSCSLGFREHLGLISDWLAIFSSQQWII